MGDKPDFSISVLRIERAEKPNPRSPTGVWVTFEVVSKGGGPLRFEMPVFVSTDHFDDADLVPAARHYLSKILDSLYAQTRQWEKTDDWIQKHSKDQDKTSQ
jgi:hypothetical protein